MVQGSEDLVYLPVCWRFLWGFSMVQFWGLLQALYDELLSRTYTLRLYACVSFICLMFLFCRILVNTCGCSLLHLLQLVRLTARSSTCSVSGLSTEKEGWCQFPGSNSLEEKDETFKFVNVGPETFSQRSVVEYGFSRVKYILVTGVHVARKRHSASLGVCCFAFVGVGVSLKSSSCEVGILCQVVFRTMSSYLLYMRCHSVQRWRVPAIMQDKYTMKIFIAWHFMNVSLIIFIIPRRGALTLPAALGHHHLGSSARLG